MRALNCLPMRFQFQVKLFVLNMVVALLLAVNYYHVGCYKDKSARAIPKSLGVWRNDNKLIEKCAQAAKQAGYSAFAIQFKSECWSGPLAHMTYSIYIGVRAIFCQGGAVNHLPKKIFTEQSNRNEGRCNNIGRTGI